MNFPLDYAAPSVETPTLTDPAYIPVMPVNNGIPGDFSLTTLAALRSAVFTGQFAFLTHRVAGDGYPNSSSPPIGGVLGITGATAADQIAIMPYSFGMCIAVKTSDPAHQAFEFHVYDATAVGYVPVLYGQTSSGGNEVQIRFPSDTNCIRLVFPTTGDPFIGTEAASTNLAIRPTADLSLLPGSAVVNHRSGTGGQYPDYRLFGNYVDATNYDRVRVRYNNASTRYEIAGDALGSQILRDLLIATGTSLGTNVVGKHLYLGPGTGTGSSGGGDIVFMVAGAGSSGTTANAFLNAWRITSTTGSSTVGSLITETDAAVNIGTPTDKRPASIWAATRVKAPSIEVSGDAGLVFTNGTDAAGANTGTLSNCPHSGNPAKWGRISWNGTTYAVPLFALT